MCAPISAHCDGLQGDTGQVEQLETRISDLKNEMTMLKNLIGQSVPSSNH